MSFMIKLLDAVTDNTLPKLYPDPMIVNGSLLLIDTSNSQGYDAGSTPPSNGSFIPNLAWNSAKDVIGSGDRNSLGVTVVNNLAGTEGIIEFTGKKAIHGIVSQVAHQNAHSFNLPYPALVDQYIYNNPTHNIFTSMWYRYTRLGSAGYPLCGGLISGPSAHRGIMMADSSDIKPYSFEDAATPTVQGRRQAVANNSTTANYFRNYAINAVTGAPVYPTAKSLALVVGSFGAWGGIGQNHAASIILYRYYVEDLTISGRTYAQVDALDVAAQSAAFAVGGKFYNDTFTAPSTLP